MKSPSVVKVDASEEVFKEYYYKYRNLVYLILKSYKLDPVVKEDIALHVFCRLPTLAKRHDPSKGKFTTYIAVVVRTVVARSLREKDLYVEKRDYNINVYDLPDEKTMPKPHNFDMKFVKDCLSEQEFDLIYNIYILNINMYTYAKKTNIKYSTVKKRHKTIIKKLREYTDNLF